jgi:hypothetical protein
MDRNRKKIELLFEGKEITGIIEAPVIGAGGIQVTSAGHGLANGDMVAIQGTAGNDGTGATVSSVATDTFEVDIAHAGDEVIGMWVKAKDGQGTLNCGKRDASQYDQAILYTIVSVWTGGTLTPTLYASPDGGTTWISTGMAGAGVGSAANELVQEVGPIGKEVRVTITLAGTEEMTFKVYLELSRTGSAGQ